MNRTVTKFLILFMMIFGVVLPLTNQISAQSSSRSGMFSAVIQKSPAVTDHFGSQVSLETMLRYLESRYNVMFFYGDETLKNKYVKSPKALLSNDPGENLARLLTKLHLSYAKVDSATYVIFSERGNDNSEMLKKIEFTVSGEVTDSTTNEPLPGVNVIVKGTTNGTATNRNGKYNLTVSNSSDTLIFSYLGYKTRIIPINGRQTINVHLQTKALKGKEMVVIGYGQKSQKLLTESVGTVSADEIQKTPVASPEQALQGKIAGVQISSTDGTPGAPIAIRIRGVSTVGNNQPLFVIDGMPVGNNSGDRITDPMSLVNPSDIQSISVLKGPSAAAIYGVRAENGVIVITTKKGRGKPSFSLNAYYGIQNAPKLWNMNNTAQYVALAKNAYDNFNKQFGYTPSDKSYLKLPPDLQPGSPYLNINTNWIGNELYRNAPIENYDLSVSGSNKNLSYYLSGGFFNQKAIVHHWQLQRFNFRSNASYQFGRIIKFGENFSLTYRQVNHGASDPEGDGLALANAATMPPFFRIYQDPNNPIPGNRYGYDGNLNVAGLSIENFNGVDHLEKQNNRTTRLLGSLNATINFTKNLSFKSQASIDASFARNTLWQPAYTAAELGIDRNTNQYTDDRPEGNTKIFTQTLHYDGNFGNNNIEAMIGTEYQVSHSTDMSVQDFNYTSSNPNFYSIVKNGSGTPTLGGSGAQQAYLSYFGRVSYNYKQKYLLTGTLRRDGSSVFAPGKRWGLFPSVSGGWIISSEPFFHNAFPFVSNLKLRASWGQLGNDQTVSYPYLFRISVTPLYGLDGNTTYHAPAPFNFVNKDVTWETDESYDFGIDMSLFNNLLSIKANYYRRYTRNFLINIPIPSLTGFTSAPVNAGEVLNDGVELHLEYTKQFTSKLGVQAMANFTTVHNKLVSLAYGIKTFTQSGAYKTSVGYPIGYFYGYKTNGIYQTPAQAAKALPDNNTSQPAQPGDVRFVDTNGDGKITADDRTYLGKTIPSYYYGFTINTSYTNWDLSIQLNGVGDVQAYNEFRQSALTMSGVGRDNLAASQNRWTGPGTSNTLPRAVATDPNNNNRFSDLWVENASYLRLQDVQLGYTIPHKWVTFVGSSVASFRIYAEATNLFTITPYKGLDPEVRTYGDNSSQLTAGTDLGNMPHPRIFRLGLKLKF